MKRVQIIPCNSFFHEEVDPGFLRLGSADYRQRLELLRERMNSGGLTHTVIYADREHFANMEYLTGFEPRFEESLLIVDKLGECTLLVGNECMSYSHISPVALRRVLYQNFSLQGQPRECSDKLEKIFMDAGIMPDSRVGLVGHKYFEPETIDGDPKYFSDVPAYINQILCKSAGDVINFTDAFTGLPDGIRMTVRTAKEVAWAEYAACRTAGVVQRALKSLRPGISELELSKEGRADFSPISAFPMFNFGSEHVYTGLRSPDDRTLIMGEPCGICYAIRGALTSRLGIAAKDEESLLPAYKNVVDYFYKPFWRAIAAWYENVYIGAVAGDVYDAVMDIIGDPKFGVTLNPGHYIGGDEWVNSPFAKDSKIRIDNSAHLQCDIIASSSDPVMTAICEDGVIVADSELRESVREEYPEVWARIAARQKHMREQLGINLSDDVLPLSNLNGVFFPYMLNMDQIFSKRAL